ncbi:unnamed protein product, partial [Iphiclides podalirius]
MRVAPAVGTKAADKGAHNSSAICTNWRRFARFADGPPTPRQRQFSRAAAAINIQIGAICRRSTNRRGAGGNLSVEGPTTERKRETVTLVA